MEKKMRKLSLRHVIYIILAAIVVTCVILFVIATVQSEEMYNEASSRFDDGLQAAAQGDLDAYRDVVNGYRAGDISVIYMNGFITTFKENYNHDDYFEDDAVEKEYYELRRAYEESFADRASYAVKLVGLGSAALLALIGLRLISMLFSKFISKEMPRRRIICVILAVIVGISAVLAVIFPIQEDIRSYEADIGLIDNVLALNQGDLGKYQDVVKGFRAGEISDDYMY
jgi:methyl-accepting chemotaxis protein